MIRMLLISSMLCIGLYAQSAQEYVENVCSNCHGFWMNEAGLGLSEAPNKLSEAQILKNLRGYKAGTLSQYGAGNEMTIQLQNISDAEIVELSKYIPTLKARR